MDRASPVLLNREALFVGKRENRLGYAFYLHSHLFFAHWCIVIKFHHKRASSFGV